MKLQPLSIKATGRCFNVLYVKWCLIFIAGVPIGGKKVIINVENCSSNCYVFVGVQWGWGDRGPIRSRSRVSGNDTAFPKCMALDPSSLTYLTEKGVTSPCLRGPQSY